MRLKRGRLAGLAVAGVFALASQATWAASININDTADNGTMNVSWTFFDALNNPGLSVNGATPSVAGSTSVSESNPVTLNGRFGLSLPLTPKTYNVVFVESAGSQLVSDVLSLSYTTDGTDGIVNGTFQSDNESGNLGLVTDAKYSGYTVYNEALGPYSFNGQNITGIASSKVDVPEPGTLALLGLGLLPLLGLGLLPRLRGRAAGLA